MDAQEREIVDRLIDRARAETASLRPPDPEVVEAMIKTFESEERERMG